MKASPMAAAGIALASTAQAQVVQFDIAKRDGPLLRDLGRRATTVNGVLSNQQVQGGYFINVHVGTPGQNITLQLDTGSSDVWVPAASAAICTEVTSRNPGCTFGSFDSGKSSTFVDVGEGAFDITYVDNTFSKGDYFQDDFQIGGVTVSNLTMGLGLDSSIANGLIGVGYINDEASLGTTRSTYPNLPVVLQQEKLTNTVAYSLWLNDLDASTGSILFGGIDTEKYQGDLTKINILKADGSSAFTEFAVELYEVQASSSSGTDTLSSSEGTLVAVLDSGTTLTYLPQDMAEQAWKEVGASYNEDFGLAVVPCSIRNSNGHFTFRFAGPQGPAINVTMSELALDLFSGGPQPKFQNGPNEGQAACEFGIQNTTGSPYLLGDTFLRSAFVVYDLVNNEIALAPTNFNSTKTNVVAFASSGAPIPSATAAPNQSKSGPSSSTGSGMSAASGFQGDKDNAAPLTSAFSGPGVMVVGMTIVYTLVGSAIFGIGWL
ncbi:aspartic peptidase domain-containing protein [Trichoderma evansii]